MREQPILFNAEMVRAILDGRKTMTRRVVKPQPSAGVRFSPFVPGQVEDGHGVEMRCPYGVERLWVRESFQFGQAPNDASGQGVVRYADGTVRIHPDLPDERRNWARIYRKRSPIFMSRWASRITLDVVSVRCERLQEIRTSQIIAEGVREDDRYLGSANRLRHPFIALWDSINAKRGYGWDSNPWVWVVEFKVIGE